jgi:hypothetical protein
VRGGACSGAMLSEAHRCGPSLGRPHAVAARLHGMQSIPYVGIPKLWKTSTHRSRTASGRHHILQRLVQLPQSCKQWPASVFCPPAPAVTPLCHDSHEYLLVFVRGTFFSSKTS